MAKVITARGESLDMDNLKAISSRPLKFRERGAEIQKRRIPNDRTPINVRGFQPKLGESRSNLSSVQPVQQDKKQALSTPFKDKNDKASPSSFSKTKIANSASDITGILVDKPKTKNIEEVDDPVEESNKVLNDIMTELGSDHPNAIKSAKKDDEQEQNAQDTSIRKSRKK